MNTNALSRALIAGCFIVFSWAGASAQCNAFVKKKCMPKISPFTNNGQMNTSTLMAGQNAQLSLTFYAGQDYRILVCAQEVIGEVSFRVMDMSKKVVFDSRDHSNPDFWDFKVRNTQQFIVEVMVPPSDSPNSIVPSGCVSVMVGFKSDK